jgi:hypothetical protein
MQAKKTLQRGKKRKRNDILAGLRELFLLTCFGKAILIKLIIKSRGLQNQWCFSGQILLMEKANPHEL